MIPHIISFDKLLTIGSLKHLLLRKSVPFVARLTKILFSSYYPQNVKTCLTEWHRKMTTFRRYKVSQRL